MEREVVSGMQIEPTKAAGRPHESWDEYCRQLADRNRSPR